MQLQSKFKPFAIREGVYAAIRAALFDGRFRPGDSINERELAEELGVSRGPLREALLLLTAEGLINHTQNYGFSVVRLSAKDCTEIDQVRLALETVALQLARERVTDRDLKELENLKDQRVEALRQKDIGAEQRADLAFHIKVAESSGNSWLAYALQRILVPYFSFFWIAREESPSLTVELLTKRHDAYLDYLRGACTTSAEDCVKFHLSLAQGLSKQLLP